MDPASVIALAGSVVSIVDVTGRSLSFLVELRAKYRKANLTVSLLIGQLSTLKAALNQISEWITTSLVGVPQHQQLMADLDVSLKACNILILVLYDRVSCLEKGTSSELRTLDKAQFLWEEKGMNDYLNHLNNQINALNLLLNAFQCRSLSEQRDLLQSSESRCIISMVGDDTSSLLWLRDTESYSCYSRKSVSTENSVMLDTVFDFDREIFRSRVYQVAARSNMKQVLKNGKRTNVQHKASHLTRDVVNLDDDNQSVQTIKEEHPNPSQPLGKAPEVQTSEDSQPSLSFTARANSTLPSFDVTNVAIMDTASPNGLNARSDYLEDMLRETAFKPVLAATGGVLNCLKPSNNPPDNWPLADVGLLMPWEQPLLSRPNSINDNHNAEESLMEAKQARRRPRSQSNMRKARTIQQLREEAQAATMRRVERGEKAQDQEIERQMMPQQIKCSRNAKVLLLGTSQSGKSTLLRSMKLLLDGPYTLGERERFKIPIFSIVTGNMRRILDAMESLQMDLDDQENEDHVKTIYMQPESMNMKCLPPEVTDAIKALWRDSSVLMCFKISQDHPYIDSAEYYFNSLWRIGQSQYVPSDRDILRSRTRTTGINPSTFIADIGFRTDIGFLADISVLDVGGIRAARKKWIYCFENVNFIIFCVDISGYDRVLFEDETTNRMQEALTLFDCICNSRWFTKTEIILLFTKIDLLESKLAVSPIGNYFPDYSDDPTDLHAAKNFICQRFVGLDQRPEKKILVQYSDIEDAQETARLALDSILSCIIERELS